MKHIATDVMDSWPIGWYVKSSGKKPGLAMDPTYRSHVTYQTELTNIIFKVGYMPVMSVSCAQW